jgi:hypothetical protein
LSRCSKDRDGRARIGTCRELGGVWDALNEAGSFEAAGSVNDTVVAKIFEPFIANVNA